MFRDCYCVAGKWEWKVFLETVGMEEQRRLSLAEEARIVKLASGVDRMQVS